VISIIVSSRVASGVSHFIIFWADLDGILYSRCSVAHTIVFYLSYDTSVSIT